MTSKAAHFRKHCRLGVGAVTLLLVTALTGCASETGAAGWRTFDTSTESAASPAAETQPLTDSKWSLTGAADATLPNFEITLEFADGKVAGKSAVNRYMGSFESANPGELKFGPLATTMMAGPEDAMAAEQAYLAELAKVNGYRLDGDQLILLVGTDEVLTYTKAS